MDNLTEWIILIDTERIDFPDWVIEEEKWFSYVKKKMDLKRTPGIPYTGGIWDEEDTIIIIRNIYEISLLEYYIEKLIKNKMSFEVRKANWKTIMEKVF